MKLLESRAVRLVLAWFGLFLASKVLSLIAAWAGLTPALLADLQKSLGEALEGLKQLTGIVLAKWLAEDVALKLPSDWFKPAPAPAPVAQSIINNPPAAAAKERGP